MESFEIERETFDSIRSRLVAEFPGRFAVVCGRALLGIRDTEADAVRFGFEHVDPLRPFLVRRIDEGQQVARLPAYVQGLLPA